MSGIHSARLKVKVGEIHLSLKYMEFSSNVFLVDQLLPDIAGTSFQFHGSTALPTPEAEGSDARPFLIERRRTRRAPCNAPAQLDAAERSLIGMCSDISLGGMLFLGPVVSVGENVKLTIEFPQLGRLRVSGEVLAHRHHEKGAGMAIRFARLGQSDLAIITRFVAEQSR